MKISLFHDKRGSGMIDNTFFVIVVFFFIAAFLVIAPVFSRKQQQDVFASELCRTAALSGRIGEETDERTQELRQQTGLSPQITWSTNGDVALGSEITVTLSSTANIGFGGIGSYPIPLISKASEKSERYWK